MSGLLQPYAVVWIIFIGHAGDWSLGGQSLWRPWLLGYFPTAFVGTYAGGLVVLAVAGVQVPFIEQGIVCRCSNGRFC